MDSRERDLDRVICKDGRVFHACEVCRKRRSRCDGLRPHCTSCQRRGLQCEYKAMRKRGRHGKHRTVTPAPTSSADAAMASSSGSSNSNAAAVAAAAAAASAAAVAAWTLAPPPVLHQPSPVTATSLHHHHQAPPSSSAAAAAAAAAFGLLGPMPSFFPLPPGMGVPGTPHTALPAPAIVTTMASMDALIGAAHAPPQSARTAARRGSSNDAGSSTYGHPMAEIQQQQHPHGVAGHHYRPRPSSAAFLGSPGSPDSTFSAHPPVALRPLSANGVAAAAAAASVFGMGSPLGMAPMLAPTASAIGLPAIGYSAQPPRQQQPSSSSAAVAAVAAMAAFQLSPHMMPPPLPPPPPPPPPQVSGTNHHHQQWPPSALVPMASPTGAMQPLQPAEAVRMAGVPERHPRRMSLDARAAMSFVPPGSATQRRPEHQQQQPPPTKPSSSSRRRNGHWGRSIGDEEEVLSGLCADGADHFGRPLFDVSKYPLPSKEDLDEHINGMFEYFYMGAQSLHPATFRRRMEAGEVSPVLVYAIMAVASRYSRKPSLHSLNGMAFLNGDRHAATACGLASILLTHGDLGTVDTVHGMLFLSVYFMGQGNMLKSRMYLVKAVCTARTMGLHHLDATFVPSRPMAALSGAFDRPHTLATLHPRPCSCPRTANDVVRLETKRRIWWFLVFVDYFTANVMNVPLEIPPDSHCVRLPCSDKEWQSATLGASNSSNSGMQTPVDEAVAHDLGFGDRISSAQQGSEYLRLNGFHDCHPPWVYRPGAFYQERLMVEFCDHLRRLNNLRALAMRSFFHVGPVYVEERYPYLRQRHQFVPWAERLEKVKAAWSWLHLQLNKWLDSILLRFSEVIHQVTPDRFNRQYRHQYYYYLLAAHSAIIMSHEVILQLNLDLSR
ncbi:hypothetical protein H4R19_001017, partial [Coemansia spiralis]